MVKSSSSDTNTMAQLSIRAVRVPVGAVGEFWLVKPLFIMGQKKSWNYTTNKMSITNFHL